MSERSGFMEHKVMICLNKTLYHAFIKLQADRVLGRSYAGLLPWIEGMYRMGYLTKEQYEENFKKYSEPLIIDKPAETRVIIEERRILTTKDRLFKAMIEQFDLHADNKQWLQKVKQQAEPFADRLESAKTLLSMIEKGSASTVQ